MLAVVGAATTTTRIIELKAQDSSYGIIPC